MIKSEDGSVDHITNGYFHKWGKSPYVSDINIVQNTYTIVKLEEGNVKMFSPNRKKFVAVF